jgi:hypothetical protein
VGVADLLNLEIAVLVKRLALLLQLLRVSLLQGLDFRVLRVKLVDDRGARPAALRGVWPP